MIDARRLPLLVGAAVRGEQGSYGELRITRADPILAFGDTPEHVQVRADRPDFRQQTVPDKGTEPALVEDLDVVIEQ